MDIDKIKTKEEQINDRITYMNRLGASHNQKEAKHTFPIWKEDGVDFVTLKRIDGIWAL